MPNSDEAQLSDIRDFTLGDVPADVWLVWTALTVAMIGYWYCRFRRSGVLSFDVFFVFLYLYLPIVFMAIFAFSPLNSAVTGESHWWYIPSIREAFYVSLTGAAAFVLASLSAATRNHPPPGFGWLRQAVCGFWMQNQGIVLLLAMTGCLGSLVVATVGVVQSREAAAQHTEFRPIAHVFSSVSVFAMLVMLVEGRRRRSWPLTGAGVMLTLAMVGFGTRKVTVGTILYYAAMRLINLRTRRVARTALVSVVVVTALVASALAVEALRQDDLSTERLASAPIHILFGNNLSELRDFAWILSGWDGELLMGRTYVSGFLSWIPSFLLPDRTELSWGRFSTRAAGLDGGTHPGLRPTVFAEAYFNFGLTGVVLFGTFLGAVFGRVAAFADRASCELGGREHISQLLCCFLFFEFFLRFQQTAGYFQSYVELLLLGGGLVGEMLFRPQGGLRRQPVLVS
jgi:oligosaccharide repeat unit polymerase